MSGYAVTNPTLLVARLNLSQQPVEIALKQAVLHDAVFLEFDFGVRLGDFSRHLASILQNFPIPQFKKAAQALFPILHGHRDFVHGLQFGHVQIGLHDALQLRQLEIREVVLGDGHIVFVDPALGLAFPMGQAHVFLRALNLPLAFGLNH